MVQLNAQDRTSAIPTDCTAQLPARLPAPDRPATGPMHLMTFRMAPGQCCAHAYTRVFTMPAWNGQQPVNNSERSAGCCAVQKPESCGAEQGLQPQLASNTRGRRTGCW